MIARELLSLMATDGARFELSGERLTVKATKAPLSTDDLSKLETLKPDAVAFIRQLQGLKPGHIVSTPYGVGRLYTTDLCLNRCGVELPDRDWPLFMSVFDIDPVDYQKSRGKLGR